MTPKIAVLSSPLEEVRPDIQDDDGSAISSVIDIEVRKEAAAFMTHLTPHLKTLKTEKLF